MNAKQNILLLTYAKFAYMQNLRICKSLPCVQGLIEEEAVVSSKYQLTIGYVRLFLSPMLQFRDRTYLVPNYMRNNIGRIHAKG